MKRLVMGIVGSATIVGCTTELPGESLGTFDIAMKLEENTCGEGAVYVTDGFEFAVELRSDDGRCYWRVPEQPLLTGTLEGTKCRFQSRSVVASNAEDVTDEPPPLIVPDPTMQPVQPASEAVCQLIQTVDLVATIRGADSAQADAGAGDAGPTEGLTLEATYALEISPSSLQDCVVAVQPKGPFEKLPCGVTYQLSGTERESFD